MAIGSTTSAERGPAEPSSTERSSAAELRPLWVRWLIPSAGDVLFVTILTLMAFTALSTRLLGDAGIGWHIRTGQIILATHSIPRVDPFSAPASSITTPQPWFAWEWLYDVLAGGLERAAGLNGVVLFTAVIIAGVFAWTFQLLLRRGTNILLALILVMLAESAAMLHSLARPHVVSWLFTVAWFWILESSEENSAAHRPHSSMLWLLPLLMLVWVNVHGGFLVGFVLLGIYWCGSAWAWWRLKGDRFDDVLRKIRIARRLRTLSLIGILSAAATLVNPYGIQLHVHIYRYLSNRFLMDHIDEFQSPNFHYVAQKCFAGLLLLTLVALAAKKREIGAGQGLVALFAVYSGLYATRNIPVSSLLLILLIGPWLSQALRRLADRRSAPKVPASTQFLRRMETLELSLRGHLWPAAALVLACWIAAHGGRLAAKPLMDAHFDAKRFPVAAVNYLKQNNVPGPIVSLDSWGGYLIYRLYPRVRMVVDDRHDFYGDEFVKSYLKMVRVEPGWQDFLQQHPAHCVLVPKDSALANILAETTGWQAIYSDDLAIAFVPTPAGRE